MNFSLRCLSVFTVTLLVSIPLQMTGNVWGSGAALAQRREERTDEALQLLQVGVQQLNTGRFKEAFAIFEKTLVIARETGDHKGWFSSSTGSWNCGAGSNAISRAELRAWWVAALSIPSSPNLSFNQARASRSLQLLTCITKSIAPPPPLRLLGEKSWNLEPSILIMMCP